MLGIEDFLLAAEAVLGIDANAIARVTKIPLAESALAAPFASFGGHDFYEHPIHRAAILASRIIRNHPLPDGNKRVALLLMDLSLEEHGYRLTASPEEIDRAFRALASREMTEDYFTVWLNSRTEPLKESQPN
jgi:death on curing protein